MTEALLEPGHDKSNKMTCVPSKDSGHPGHPPSPISIRCLPEEGLGPYILIRCAAKTLIGLGNESLLAAHIILWILLCSSSFSFMSFVTRKPVFGVFDQVRRKPACAVTEAR